MKKKTVLTIAKEDRDTKTQNSTNASNHTQSFVDITMEYHTPFYISTQLAVEVWITPEKNIFREELYFLE
jgi:hypothetical protein